MKKLFLILFLALLLVVPMVSAVKVEYTKNDKQVDDMKVVISDTILFGLIKTGEQGTMELKSHKTPTEVIQVGTGWQVTMIYETNFGQAHKGALGGVTFINMRNGKEVERDYKFVYWGTEEYESPIYTCSNVTSLNGTISNECTQTGTETKKRKKWLDFNSRDIPKGQITLGLMTYVLPNDYVDGVWEVSGKKIDKHAAWTADLNTGLIDYWTMDAVNSSWSGTFNNISETNDRVIENITNGVSLVDGKIGKAINFTKTGNFSYINHSTNFNNSFSMNWWSLQTQSGSDNYHLLSADRLGGGGTQDVGFHIKVNSSNYPLLQLRSTVGGTFLSLNPNITIQNNQPVMYTITSDGTTIKLFINNTLAIVDNLPADRDWTNIYQNMPRHNVFTGAIWIDEIGRWNRSLSSSEITQLYNGGDGISYTDSFGEVTSLSPDDDFVSGNQTVEFIGNTTYTDVVNFSLIINDTYEQTNTSGLSGNYSFTETLSDGVYSWKFESCDSVEGCVNSTARTLTIDTTPFIEFVSPTPDNASNLSVPYIPVNVTLTETYFENVTFNFYKGGVLNESVTFTNDTRFYNKTGCTCDNWEINVTTCTTTGQCNSTETRLLTIDILAPEIVINAGEGVQDYGSLNINHTINFTVNDTHLDSVWIKYKNQISVSDIKLDDNNLNIPVTTGEYYLNFTKGSNDTLAVGTCDSLTSCEGSYSYGTIPSSCLTNENVQVKVDVISSTQIDLNCYNSSSEWNHWTSYLPIAPDRIYLTELGINPNETINIEGASSGILNSTSLELVKDLYNAKIYANDTFGNVNSYLVNWSYKVFENSNTFNTTTYETASETFSTNITANTSLTAVTLDYNGTDYVMTKSGTVWSKTLDIPEGVSNRTLRYKYTYAGDTFYSDYFYQNISLTYFTLCNATYSDDFLNITFKDEASLEYINATIPTSTFEYYLGSGTVTKTLSYTNTTENYNYLFCATPDRTFNVDPYVQYKKGTEYPQRIWNPEVTQYNSTVIEQQLYLASSLDGIYVTFQVIDSSESGISGVSVIGNRTIDSESVIVADGTTGAGGGVTFWLNPDFVHTFTFSKEGYDDYIIDLTPTQSTYTVTLGGEAPENPDYTTGILSSITPSDSFLQKNEEYNFIYTISAQNSNLQGYGFTLKADGSTISTQSGTNPSGESLNYVYNISSVSRMVMDYYYIINGTTINKTRYWDTYTPNDFSLSYLFTDLNNRIDENVFGIEGDDEGVFAKALLSLLILIVGAGILSSRYGLASEQAVSGIIFGLLLFLESISFLPSLPADFPINVNLGQFIVFVAALWMVVSIFRGER